MNVPTANFTPLFDPDQVRDDPAGADKYLPHMPIGLSHDGSATIPIADHETKFPARVGLQVSYAGLSALEGADIRISFLRLDGNVPLPTSIDHGKKVPEISGFSIERKKRKFFPGYKTKVSLMHPDGTETRATRSQSANISDLLDDAVRKAAKRNVERIAKKADTGTEAEALRLAS